MDLVSGGWIKDTPEERLRQDLARALVEEYGYAVETLRCDYRKKSEGRGIGFELVVLERSSETSPLRIAVVIRQPGSRFDESVLSDLPSGIAPYVAWYSGEELHVFARNSATGKALRRLPHFPRLGETPTHFGRYTKEELRPAHDLKVLFRRIHNVLYGSSNMRMASKLSDELIKILFCKIYDELAVDKACIFGISVDEMQGEEGKRACVKRIGEIFSAVKAAYPEVFSAEERLMLDDASIAYVVGELEPFSLLSTPLDAVGAAFEVFLGSHVKGEKGEFFTPRPVVSTAVEILLSEFDVDRLSSLRFVDPAMGTAGFLTVYLQRAKASILEDNKDQSQRKVQSEVRKLQEHVTGVDIETEQVRIAKAYMAIMGNPHTVLFHADSLQPPSRWEPLLVKSLPPESHDLLLTNPPFGTKIPVSDPAVLRQYDLACKWVSQTTGVNLENFDQTSGFKVNQKWRKSNLEEPRSQVPDILFLERCLGLLKAPTRAERGGRMGIVLPRQILSGDDKQFVRQWIFNNARVLAVIDLPVEAFQPFTGTKTSLLFLERGRPSSDHEIFMAVSEEIGHDRRGNPVYLRDEMGELRHDAHGLPIVANDLPQVVGDYKAYSQGKRAFSSRSFVVKFSDVQFSRENAWGRLDASFYKPSGNSPASLPKGWKLARIGDVADVTYPGRFKRNYVEEGRGVPFLSGNDATQVEPDTKFISSNTPNMDEYLLKKGWTLVTRSGTVGIVMFVGERLQGYAASEHLLRVVPKGGKVHPGFLYAFLSSSRGVGVIKQGIYGSVVDEITPDYVKSIEIPLPPIDVQEKIGKLVEEAEAGRARAVKQVQTARTLVLDAIGK